MARNAQGHWRRPAGDQDAKPLGALIDRIQASPRVREEAADDERSGDLGEEHAVAGPWREGSRVWTTPNTAMPAWVAKY